MTRTRWAKWMMMMAVGVVGVVAVVAEAQERESSTEPAARSDRPWMPDRSTFTQRPGGGGELGGAEAGEPPRERRWGRWRGPEEMEEDWPAVESFMREHSPRRWEAFQMLRGDTPRHAAVRRFIHARWANLMGFERENPAVYENRLKILQAEDALFGLRLDVAQASDDAERGRLMAEMQARAADLVDARLAERRLRIDAAERKLAEERKRLERDMGQRSALVERELTEQAKEPPGHFGERGGSGGPGRGEPRRHRGGGDHEGPPPIPPEEQGDGTPGPR